ncbi:MAG: glutamine synthetase family protein [Actinomycetota bacterium]
MGDSLRLGGPEQRRIAEGMAADLRSTSVELVAATFVDNSGIARVKGVPIDRLPDVAQWGVGFSPVADVYLLNDGFTESATAGGPVGDLRLVPDLDALTLLPAQPGWAWVPVDRFTQTGDIHPQCQRSLVRRQRTALADHGLDALMAFELEWMLSSGDGNDFIPATTAPAYGTNRMVELSDYCIELTRALETQGLHVQQLHPEYAAGQFEVSIAPGDPLEAADHSVLAKQTIRAVGLRNSMRTTFAPCATADGVGNGMHLHLSLWDGEHNTALGGDGPANMSPRYESFLAGVLDHSPALLAVTAPSVASYLRLQPQHWSAPFRCWGVENREAAVRIVGAPAGQPEAAANAEIKTIDATASPYLVVAAVLAAGIDGLDRGLTLPPPVDVDPATMDVSTRTARGIERLPATLIAATDQFAHDEVLRRELGVALHETLIAIRRAEIELFADATDDEVVAATRKRH